MEEQALGISEAQAGEASLGEDHVPRGVDGERPNAGECCIRAERIDQYGETRGIDLRVGIQEQHEIRRAVRTTNVAAVGKATIAWRPDGMPTGRSATTPAESLGHALSTTVTSTEGTRTSGSTHMRNVSREFVRHDHHVDCGRFSRQCTRPIGRTGIRGGKASAGRTSERRCESVGVPHESVGHHQVGKTVGQEAVDLYW